MKANIRTISSLLGLIILLSLPGSLKGQTTGAIFKVVPNAKSALSVSEFNRYTDINKDPIKEKSLIDITGLEQDLQKSMVSVSLKGLEYALRNVRFSNTGEESFNLKEALQTLWVNFIYTRPMATCTVISILTV